MNKSRAYYNEKDPYAAEWLRTLIVFGYIAPGDVDERSIEDVRPDELRGYAQCHFFAGIGVWSHALRNAGWPDDRPVWTGSCPCQPFSAAGKRGGTADERHLWPHWFHLIEHGKPRDVPVLGEQVASKDGLAWLDLVHADLEGQGYTVGALDLCAAGVGAPHIRQRIFFVAEPDEQQRDGSRNARPGGRQQLADECRAGELAYANGGYASAEGLQRGREHGQQPEDCGARRGMADAVDGAGQRSESRPTQRLDAQAVGKVYATNGFWRDAEWLPCIDGKARPVEPGTFPLAHGAPARVGRLRAYGNAIVAPLAEEFIRAYLADRR